MGCVQAQVEEKDELIEYEKNEEIDSEFEIILIKFHQNDEGVTCKNLEMYTKLTLQQNFPEEYEQGKIKFYEVNVESNPEHPFLELYPPQYPTKHLSHKNVSFTIVVKNDEFEKYEEIAELWHHSKNSNYDLIPHF